MDSQAENGARLGGEDQQASSTRATITMVALIGSKAFSCLDSQSIRWLEFTIPLSSESACDQPHSPA